MTYHAPFPELIDSTALVTWRACAQKGALSHFDLLTTGPSVDLHFGGAIAAGLERARKDYFQAGLPPREAENNGLDAAWTFWADFTPPDNHAKSLPSLLQAMDGYFKQWPLDTDEVRPLSSTHGIEFTFALPIDEVLRPDRPEPILYAGRFDLLGTLDTMLCLVDEKTTGRSFSSSWSQGWNLRNQFLMYVWACRRSGIALDKVLIRGISILKSGITYIQLPVFYPEFLVERAYRQVVRDLRRMADQWHEGYFDYNFGDTCSTYGGCPFLDVCSAMNPHEWHSMFLKRSWNPLQKDPSNVTV